MKIQKGQSYSVNVFDLGFTNIYPFDILVRVEQVDYSEDRLILSPHLIPDIPSPKHFHLVENWFHNVYPVIDKTMCILKSPSTFARLIHLHYARLE
jgi:hypothetical protein